MKKYIHIIAILSILLVIAIPVQSNNTGVSNIAWMLEFTSNDVEFPQECVADSYGNLFVVGWTRGEFGGNNYLGESDAYMAKISSSGKLLFVYQFGTAKTDVAGSVAIDNKNNVYVSGATNGALDGQRNYGGFDGFIMKLDHGSKILWKLQFGSSESDYIYDIAIASDGSIYAVGATLGSIDNGNNKGKYDIFVVKISPEGKLLWVKQIGTSNNDEAFLSDFDSQGNLYLVGFTEGAFQSGSNKGENDAILLKLSPEGNVLWVNQFGSSGDDEATVVSVDRTNMAVYVAGSTYGQLAEKVYGDHSANDFFIAKFSLNGNIEWIKQFGTAGSNLYHDHDKVYYIKVENSGNILVSGQVEGKLSDKVESVNGPSPFIMELNPRGNINWLQQYPSYINYTASSIAIDKYNNVFLTLGYNYNVGGHNSTYIIKLGDNNPENTNNNEVTESSTSETHGTTATSSSQTLTSSSNVVKTGIQDVSKLAKSINWHDPKTIILLLIVILLIAILLKK
ncbi:MAG: hypothetical protein GSR79_10150 [Desulfurococcales archaeon]|nr:hypothetical protein [Desulfurococcales archaeon]